MGKELALGVDLIEVDRFTRALRRWPALVARMFTTCELTTCLDSPNADERLAARFAAKEAVFKALGDGWPRISYRDVEIVTLDDGAPALALSGRAAVLAGRRAFALSLSHDSGMAMAGVVACPTEEG
ncbi:MAG: holo-ACP synthase [Actinomycetota bacterium]